MANNNVSYVFDPFKLENRSFARACQSLMKNAFKMRHFSRQRRIIQIDSEQKAQGQTQELERCCGRGKEAAHLGLREFRPEL
jgi:hypothetical protein